MVTAELALALPSLVVALALALWAVSAVSAQVRCVDAARSAARAAARGEPDAAVEAAARAAAPAGATVTVARAAGLVEVDVAVHVHPLPGGPGARLPALTVHAAATAPDEAAGDP